MKAAKDREHLDRRNRELAFLQIAIEVVRAIREENVPEDQVRPVASRLLAKLPDDVRTDGGMGIVRGYFSRLAKDGKVPEGMERETMQACANIFMRRSGHFKRAKKFAGKVSKEGRMKTTAKVVESMEEEKARVEQRFGVQQLKIQNFSPYQAALLAEDGLSSEDAMKIAGDAERTRIPWRVLSGQEAPKGEIAKVVAAILGTDEPAAVLEGQIVAQDDISGSIKAESLDSKLRALTHGDKAADLLSDLQRMNLEGFCTTMRLPVKSTRTFLACSGFLDEDKSCQFLLHASEILLDRWQDPVTAERIASLD